MENCSYKRPGNSLKMIFFHGKDRRFSPRIIRKRGFIIGQVLIKKIWIENPVFANHHVGNKKASLNSMTVPI